MLRRPTVQIKKNATAASAMTNVASHPTTSIGGGSVSRPMMRGFIAITIMTAISGSLADMAWGHSMAAIVVDAAK
jgi:hypothetical protein